MRAVLWFGWGIAIAFVLMLLTGVVILKTVAGGFRADAKPTAAEAWAARTARNYAMPSAAKQRTNPIPASSTVLVEARAHWADHCAVCHGNDGSGKSEMGQHMYPQSLDMRNLPTQEMTDGQLFYIIQNGIRLSGMPAWGSDHSGEDDSWKLVHFIRHLPRLSDAELREMETLNPRGPQELQEENEEKQFLNGQTLTTPPHSHHPHEGKYQK